MVNIHLLITSAICFTVVTGAKNVKRLVNGTEIKTNENLRIQIEANNGDSVPRGKHPYFVVFKKKPNFYAKYDKFQKEEDKDFSLKGSYICSGTIMTARWVLTTVKPIAYYPIGSYWMISQHSIPAIADQEMLDTHEIDIVLIHPEYDSEEGKYDLALARTSTELKYSFITESVNRGTLPHINCKLVVWSWYFNSKSDTTLVNMDKSEVSYEFNSTSCSKNPKAFEEYFLCLVNPELKRKHCGINIGAPIICESVLIGVFRTEIDSCNNGTYLKGYKALRVTKPWFDYVLSPTVTLRESEISGLTQKVCKRNISQRAHFQVGILLLVLLVTINEQ